MDSSRARLLRVVPRILALVLVGMSMASCSSLFMIEVSSLGFRIEDQPGVVSVDTGFTDGIFRGKSAEVGVELSAAASTDELAAVVREISAAVAKESFADASVWAYLTRAESTGFELRTVAPSPGLAAVLDTEVRAWAALAAAHPTRFSLQWLGADRPHERSVTVEIEEGAPGPVGDAFQELAGQPFPPAASEWEVIARDSTGTSTYNFSGNLPADPILPVVEDVAGVAELAGPGDRVAVAVHASPSHVEVDVDLAVADLRDIPCNVIDSRTPGSSAERLGQIYWERLAASGVAYELTASICQDEPFLEVSGGP